MERRWSLADLLAVPAGELLAHMLDHLPLARDRFQRLGDIFAQLAQPTATAAKASSRSRHDHPLARQMLGEGLARGPLAGERRHLRGLGDSHLGGDLVFGGRTFQLLELQLDLIQKPRRAFRARPIKLARQLLDPKLLMGDQGLIIGGLGSGHRKLRFGLCRLASLAASAMSAAFSASMSSGRALKCESMIAIKSQILAADSQKMKASATILHAPAGRYEPGSSNRSRRACRRAAKPRFQPRRRLAMAR